MNDDDWLVWAWEQVAEANDVLNDGYQYELENCTFGAIIAGYCENSGMGLIPSKIINNPLPLTTVTKVVKDSYSWIAPKTVGSILRRWNITVRNKGGKAHVFTTIEQLRKIAKEIGYEDSAL